MKRPPENVDTVLEERSQGLPSDLGATAREFKAFARARKVKSVRDLLRLVLYAITIVDRTPPLGLGRQSPLWPRRPCRAHPQHRTPVDQPSGGS